MRLLFFHLCQGNANQNCPKTAKTHHIVRFHENVVRFHEQFPLHFLHFWDVPHTLISAPFLLGNV